MAHIQDGAKCSFNMGAYLGEKYNSVDGIVFSLRYTFLYSYRFCVKVEAQNVEQLKIIYLVSYFECYMLVFF